MSDLALAKLKEEVVQVRKELHKTDTSNKDRRTYEFTNKHYSHPKEALLSQLKVISFAILKRQTLHLLRSGT